MDERVRRKLERLARQAQAQARVPALQVAVHRADRGVWTFEVGRSGTDRPLDSATTFRIGSVTKTFIAVAVLQCRDEGLLALDDPLSAHLPVTAFGDATIRRLLSHTAGVQREPHGDIWAAHGSAPTPQRLFAELAQAEQVLPGGSRFHYSNLAFSLLGQLVERVRGGAWFDVLADRILKPLGLTTISPHAGPESAVGYLVDAYSDHAVPEGERDLGATGAAGALWGTAADLAKWAGYLADPATVDPAGTVLKTSTVEEMRLPQTVTNPTRWAVGYGLGVILQPQPDWAMHVGHDGAMPGFLTGCWGRSAAGAPPALGVGCLGSSGTADDVIALAHRLLNTTVEMDPPDIETWAPSEPAPHTYRSALGRWWSEGFELVFSWREGRLQAVATRAPDGMPPAVFAETDQPDVLRTVSGREVGELLRLVRDDSGQVQRMYWATYPVTRDQQTFDGTSMTG